VTKARRKANGLRAILLVAGVLYTLAALAWLFLPAFDLDVEPMPAGLIGTPLGWFPGDTVPLGLSESQFYAALAALVVGLVLLAQWAFLRPGAGLPVRLAARGRPLRRSVIAAAAMAMLLTTGMIALVLEACDVWESLWHGDGRDAGIAVWSAMLVLWLLWTWVFWVYWRQGDQYTQLGKIVRALVAGSLLEAVIAIPVHVRAIRHSDCYCEKGTYTTFVLAGTVLLWAFGPGIVLLYMRDRYRAARVLEPCAKCGYSLRGNESGVCPECGAKVVTGG